MSGYYGPNCNFTCPYPSFGPKCLEGKCQCQEENCDPISGCRSGKSVTCNHVRTKKCTCTIFLAASVLVYELYILYLRYMYIYKTIDINTFEKIVTGRSP